MSKARNMIIDGYLKGTQLHMDQYGIFYIFNGRNPIDDVDIESYQILTEESTKDAVSTVGRGIVGSALFGRAGATASLTGKENKIYTIRVNWDTYIYKDKDNSIFELDNEFYKMFLMKCVRSEKFKKQLEEMRSKPPEKYKYNYRIWCEYNNVELVIGKPRNEKFVEALFDNPETNPLLDCCRTPNPEYEEYIKAQQLQSKESSENMESADIKSKLKELKSMYEEDLITEEEYEMKRKELLDRI